MLSYIERITGIPPDLYVLFIPIILLIYGEWWHVKGLTTYQKSKQQIRAQNPPVDKKWKWKEPKHSIVIGEAEKSYFAVPERKDLLNILLLGGSGSGKTSGPLACTIIQNAQDRFLDPDNTFTYMCIDLKGEIHRLIPDSLYVKIDPTDRLHSVGWDPYFRLTSVDRPSDDLKIEVFSGIAKSLIPISEKNRYFSDNATAMLSGFLAYGYEQKQGMVDTVLELITNNVPDHLARVCESMDPNSVPAFFLKKFSGKSSEGFEDVCSTMTTSLSCFSLQEVQYVLRDNPLLIGPDKVRETNVFLAVPDNLLTESQFAPIFRMIIEQQMTFLTMKLPETDTHPVGILIDEFYAIGQLSIIKHQLSICRGYGVFIFLCTQSVAGIEELYGKEGARIIMENCRIKIILELTDSGSASAAVDWCGTFHERMVSKNNRHNSGITVSWQVKNVFDKADFTDLVARKRVIVITPSGMNQITKLQWFRSKYFKRVHDELLHNT